MGHCILRFCIVNKLIDDFIAMNQAGLVLELCEKYYAEDVIMLNNGKVFAKSMRESYDKQKGFVSSIKEFTVELVSKTIDGNVAELTFNYKMMNSDSTLNEFTGKHIQTWKNDKIIKEEYVSV
ncbi:hypothetical protein CXF79_12640 [Colwellia sp. Bg11-28]|nr:hypothetical protein CXF79_12640 [Colwellia sp. Bg11-28]